MRNIITWYIRKLLWICHNNLFVQFNPMLWWVGFNKERKKSLNKLTNKNTHDYWRILHNVYYRYFTKFPFDLSDCYCMSESQRELSIMYGLSTEKVKYYYNVHIVYLLNNEESILYWRFGERIRLFDFAIWLGIWVFLGVHLFCNFTSHNSH